MDRQNHKALDSTQEPSLTAATSAPSDRLYQVAAVTVVLLMLATMF